MSELIKTIVVDDHSLFRECVVRSLLESGCFDVVAQSDSHVDALEKVARHTPDIVLLDISLPGGGIGTAKEIAERVPDTKVIMLTVSEAEDDVQDALLAYAKAYVLKG
ncbi:MAG TPA: DNA-binding response regulator, partial [Gammaproteobacteria bacterium]|nr:DNA-binding response regulator [Gammaproteobacteria bacterium]